MGTLVWWDLRSAPPPPNLAFLDHLLASHLAMHTGLFHLAPPLTLRAHGNLPLPDEAHNCIVKRNLTLQQSISNGDSEHAMVVDMLLWAVDHAPEKQREVIVISTLVNGAMADVVNQLHLRNFNVVVSSSFPPKNLQRLGGAPPRIMLQQILSDVNNREESEEALITSPARETLVLRCRSLVEEWLRAGISAFLEHDFCAAYRSRHGERLRFDTLEALLRECVPGVSFRSLLLAAKPWILCTPTPSSPSLIEEMRVRQSVLISDMARPATQVVDNHRALTMKEVSGWLREMVACGRADGGVNLSHLGKDFEEHHGGKKLNHKSLHCPSLMALLSKFETIVRMERKDSMVILFPSNQPQIKRVNCTSVPRIVQVPGQISIRKNIAPVPKFSTKIECQASERINHDLPVANRERFLECREYLLPKDETPSDVTPAENPKPDSSPLTSSLASDPVNVASSAAASDPVNHVASSAAASDPVNHVASSAAASDPVNHVASSAAASDPVNHVASSAAASDRNMDVDSTVTPPPPSFGAAKRETNGGQKFDFYSSQVVQEREAIKRTFQSVNRRLQEEFKKRKLATNNNTAN